MPTRHRWIGVLTQRWCPLRILPAWTILVEGCGWTPAWNMFVVYPCKPVLGLDLRNAFQVIMSTQPILLAEKRIAILGRVLSENVVVVLVELGVGVDVATVALNPGLPRLLFPAESLEAWSLHLGCLPWCFLSGGEGITALSDGDEFIPSPDGCNHSVLFADLIRFQWLLYPPGQHRCQVVVSSIERPTPGVEIRRE